MLIELLLFLVVLTFWWRKRDKERYEKYPPGPTRWPIVGNIPQIMLASPFPSTALKILSRKYGDVFFVKIGGKETVVFNTLDVTKEMLLHESTSFRSQDFEFVKMRNGGDKNLGVIWGNGKTWQNLRRFTMRNLRDFGFGKSSTMDIVVNEEIDKFIQHIQKQLARTRDNVLNEKDPFNVTMVNVLWRLASGKSYELDDPAIIKLVNLNRTFFETTNMGVDLGDTYPILRTLFPNWTGKNIQEHSCQALFDYGKQLVKVAKEEAVQKADPDSFIDVFTSKVESSQGDADSDFNDEQFVMVLLDLLVGGSETSSNTMNFGMLYMLLNPQIQEKVQAEIDKVVPGDALITSDMKSKLPYTHATVLEILRQSTIIPMPSPREATEDFYFRGKYFIPKGMPCLPNTYAIHHDKDLWGDPESFRPERFLNKDETALDQKTVDKLIAFGAGKRYCLGQSLAECTMFLYFARMMRQFKFEKVPGTNPTPEPMLGLTLVPHPYSARVTTRK